MRGKPLDRPDQITDRDAVDKAIEALVHGGDEPVRDTKAEPGSEDIMWFEELQNIDDMLAEAVGEDPSKLPSKGLLEQIDVLKDKLWTWFVMPTPKYERRIVREAINELSGLSNALRDGSIAAAEAQNNFNSIFGEVTSIIDWTRFLD
jgi:hypothetical protein